MEILYVLIPLGLILVGIALWAFFWAVDNHQFDDLDTPAYSILNEPNQPLSQQPSDLPPP